jgi:hypothetical protein
MKIDAGLMGSLEEVPQRARGRFILGIGSQIAPHVTKRFSDRVDRILCTFPYATEAERQAYLEELRAT